MNLSDAIEGYLLFKSARASPETIKTDSWHLKQLSKWLGERDVREVASDDVRRYLNYEENERGLSKHTTKRIYAVISAMYTWLTSEAVGLADVNPCRGVPMPKPPKGKVKSIEQEHVSELLDACSKTRSPRRNRALLRFMLDTGARVSEVAGVGIGDVNFASGKVKVFGKGQKERFVYLGKRALSAVWLYVKEERPEPAQVKCSSLFLTIDGYPMSRNSIRCVTRRLSKITGKHVHPHMFRHTAAIEHLRHGMDVFSLQHLLGHEDLQTTRQYLAALNDEDVEKRARRTSPGDNWRL